MPLPALVCEVAFDRLPGDDVAEADWTDLSDRVRNAAHGELLVESSRGRVDETAQPPAGHATVRLDNSDRELDPDNDASQWAGSLDVLRWVRLSVDYGGVRYPLVRGLAEQWQPYAPTPADELVEVPLVDGSTWLARVDLPEWELPRQSSGDRVHAILDAAGWPGDLRDIDSGEVTVEPVELDADANARDLLEDTADAEAGVVWVDAAGVVVFRSRHARLEPRVVGPVATFGPGEDEYDVLGVAFSRTDRYVVNDARLELADGRRLGAVDSDSIDRYGRRSAQTTDLPLRDAEAEGVALWQLARYRETQPRPRPLTVHPLARAGLLEVVLDVELGDLVKLRREHSAGGDPAEVLAHVEGVRHDVAAAQWTTTLDLSPYFGEGPWLVLVDENDEPSDKRVALEDGMLAP